MSGFEGDSILWHLNSRPRIIANPILIVNRNRPLPGNDKVMPRDFRPSTGGPRSLVEIGVAERQAGEDFDVAEPDLVDGVAWVEVVFGFDAVDGGEFVAHFGLLERYDGYGD